ncbi:MAG TPA: NrsF family protein [Polyangiaceae bacterium]|nr:NrsF family protein [Polyangiaceae bacterium]
MKGERDPRLLSRIPDPFDGGALASVPAAPRPDFYAPSRARVHVVRGIALAAALAYEAFWLVVLQAHRGDRTKATIVAGFLIPLVASVAATFAAMRRGARGLGEPVAAIAGATGGAVLLFVTATLIAAPLDTHHKAFWPDAFGCMGISSLFVVGPLAIGLYAFRRAFASAATWRALALGTACGALATVMMSVVCPDGGQFHVLIGHGTVIVAGCAAGGLLGRLLARA